MAIEISKEARAQAIASIERYFRENMDEKIGNVAAGGLLGYFLEELGPVVYNKAVADVQERLDTYGAEDGGGTIAKFEAFMQDERVKWAKIVKESGARVD